MSGRGTGDGGQAQVVANGFLSFQRLGGLSMRSTG